MRKENNNKKIVRTVRQHSKGELSEDTLKMLKEIAHDYSLIRKYVYSRYGGIRSFMKISPGFEVQKEMQNEGIRQKYCVPSVYYQRAIYEALGDIRGQWEKAKAATVKNAVKGSLLTEDEKHYLFFLLKLDEACYSVLCNGEPEYGSDFKEKAASLECEVDTKKVGNYLKRQLRNNYHRPHVKNDSYFLSDSRGYTYVDGGIEFTSKKRGKRIFIPLTDGCRYSRQIRVRIFDDEKRIEIIHPIEVQVKKLSLNGNIGVAIGYYVMLTTDKGHRYGREISLLQKEYDDWIKETQRNRSLALKNGDIGNKKYQKKKRAYEERLHSYINATLNEFFKMEMPETVYIAKLPPAGGSEILARWQRGYIEKRLAAKCQIYGTKLVRVKGKGISNGGNSPDDRLNAAIEALERGMNHKNVIDG